MAEIRKSLLDAIIADERREIAENFSSQRTPINPNALRCYGAATKTMLNGVFSPLCIHSLIKSVCRHPVCYGKTLLERRDEDLWAVLVISVQS